MCLFSAMIGTFEFKTCNLNFIFLDIQKKKRDREERFSLDCRPRHNTFLGNGKMASLHAFLKENLNLRTIEDQGSSGGGCISNSRHFSTDIGNLFVKTYIQEKVR